MHHRNPAVAGRMRVGIFVSHAAVRGPPGMPHACGALHTFHGKALVDLDDPADSLCNVYPVVMKSRYPDAVVPAVFHEFEAVYEKRGSIFASLVSKYGAHVV